MPSSPIPVHIGEDWNGSLAAQVARQLRHRNWTRGPVEEMVKTLGSHGLICPLVDSLSERSMEGAIESVKSAISDHHFRHLIVTSREKPPGDQIWQAMRHVTPRPLVREDTRSFIEIYLSNAEPGEVERIENEIAPILDSEHMPSPMFLRFSIEQAVRGPLKAVDRLSLVLEYVEALRSDRVDIRSSDMKRAASIAAMESVQDHLVPQEFPEQQLNWALVTECNAMKFYDAKGETEVTAPKLVDMLVQSGLIVRGANKLQFSYDPVAEYLAAWWISEARPGALDVLRERIEDSGETGVRQAYQDILNTKQPNFA